MPNKAHNGVPLHVRALDFFSTHFFYSIIFNMDTILKNLKAHGFDLQQKPNGDFFFISEGHEKLCKIRIRRSGKDVLIPLFDPYYSIDSPDTKIGKDRLKYDFLFYLINNICYVVDKKTKEQLINGVLEEWKEHNYALPEFLTKNGCCIKYLSDNKTSKPKVLLF